MNKNRAEYFKNKFTENAEQFDSLMVEMLNENKNLLSNADQRLLIETLNSMLMKTGIKQYGLQVTKKLLLKKKEREQEYF